MPEQHPPPGHFFWQNAKTATPTATQTTPKTPQQHTPTPPNPVLNIRVSGASQAIAQAIRSAKDVPARVIPYAAATAMTRVAQQVAKNELPAAMQTAFDRPTRWTLNSLRIEPATKATLTARIHVKNQTPSGTPQENYLLPGVEGGTRKEKGLERALRYRGFIRAGYSVLPGRNAPTDAHGNLPRALIASINTWAAAGAPQRTKRVKGQKTQNPSGYFLFGKPTDPRGIARRTGKNSITPLLIFTKTVPQYTPRLDFTATAEAAVQAKFPAEFARAAAAIAGRNA